MKGIESQLTGGYWGRWQAVNQESAIFHQWAQLEATGCIDNFCILAEGKPVSRQGWFFAVEIVRQFIRNNRRVDQAQKQVNEDQAGPGEPRQPQAQPVGQQTQEY